MKILWVCVRGIELFCLFYIMKTILIFCICTLLISPGCTGKSETANLNGRWVYVRLDKSPSSKTDFENFKRKNIAGVTYQFTDSDILYITQNYDTSRHYYTLSADKKFLMFELFGGAASLHKIILLNKDSFKLSMNFNDTIVFARLK